jgi:hypothetical protein
MLENIGAAGLSELAGALPPLRNSHGESRHAV